MRGFGRGETPSRFQNRSETGEDDVFRDNLKKLYASPALGDVLRWSKPARLGVAGICFTNAVNALCSLGTTLCTKGLIDGATGRDFDMLRRYGILLVVLAALESANGYAHRLWKRRTDAKLYNYLCAQTLRRLLDKQYAGLEGYHSGELVSRVQGDVSLVRNGIIGIAPKLVSMLVGFFGAAAILISMDWRFAFVLVAMGVLGAWLLAVLRHPMKRRQTNVRRFEGIIQSTLQETLQNIRLVKASGSEARMVDKLRGKQGQYYDTVMDQAAFSAKANLGIGSLFHVSWLFCMLWGGWGIYRGALTYGSLAAIIRLVGEIQAPISEASDVAAQALYTVTSAERLKELLDLPDEEEGLSVSGRELYQNLQDIRAEHLTFSYGRESGNVLEDAALTIRPGSFVALTGASGGGKSTLFQLLLGIYHPTDGRLDFRFNDHTEPASRRTRPLFAYVPQGNTLFSGTLRENFAMFSQGVTDEEIMDAAKVACIDELVAQLDDGLDTVIGERGVGLSEGQAQRVAVARALLSRSPILLLDEATSALDEATEALLLSHLEALRDRGQELTCLIVTHRRAALSICDYRLHLEQGRFRRMDESEAESV